MRVEVLFRSHRYEEFDTSPQTCSEPYRGMGTAILMDWNLHIDLDPEGMGIVLVQHWYDGSVGSGQGTVRLGGVEVPVGAHKLGCAMLLVAPEELSEVVWLKKDGEKILWREGDDLINGERFFAMEQLCYSDAVTKSVNKRALAVFDYLTHAHPDWDDADVAGTMGYTASAIERIREAELSQGDVFDEEGADESEGYIEEGEADGENDQTSGFDFS